MVSLILAWGCACARWSGSGRGAARLGILFTRPCLLRRAWQFGKVGCGLPWGGEAAAPGASAWAPGRTRVGSPRLWVPRSGARVLLGVRVPPVEGGWAAALPRPAAGAAVPRCSACGRRSGAASSRPFGRCGGSLPPGAPVPSGRCVPVPFRPIARVCPGPWGEKGALGASTYTHCFASGACLLSFAVHGSSPRAYPALRRRPRRRSSRSRPATPSRRRTRGSPLPSG